MAYNVNDQQHTEQARDWQRVNAGFDPVTESYNLQDIDQFGMVANRNYVWDTDTLSWVKMTQATGGGGTGYEVVGVKNAFDTRIDPATEGTLTNIWGAINSAWTDGGNSDQLRVFNMGALTQVIHDEIALTYNGFGEIETVTYKLGGVTQATLTLSYNASNKLSGVVRT